MHIHPNAALLAIDVQKGFELAPAGASATIPAWRPMAAP